MASSPSADEGSSPAPALDPRYDPFVSNMPPTSAPSHHRFSNFDSQLFALGPNASPAQAKRALEAHLSETDRRMEEAGKLGTALVQQRKELTERLKEVEKLEAEGELSTDLRQKLVEIEKDYNEVAKESARAFLPKQRIPSNEAAAGSPFVPEGKGGRVSLSQYCPSLVMHLLIPCLIAFCKPLQVRGPSYGFSVEIQCPQPESTQSAGEPDPRYRVCSRDQHITHRPSTESSGTAF